MIALDTNLLVYAHREDSPHHAAALGMLEGLVSSAVPWALPWPCVPALRVRNPLATP